MSPYPSNCLGRSYNFVGLWSFSPCDNGEESMSPFFSFSTIVSGHTRPWVSSPESLLDISIRLDGETLCTVVSSSPSPLREVGETEGWETNG